MLKTTITLDLRTKDLSLVKSQQQEMKSWLKHLWDLFYVQTMQATLGITDISSVSRNVNMSGYYSNQWQPSQVLFIAGAAGGVRVPVSPFFANGSASGNCLDGEKVGLVVGTNNTAVTPSDDKLGTIITHGMAAGQLLYGGTEVGEFSFANPNGSMLIRRFFTNKSGGVVTVEECGIYAVGAVPGSVNAYSFCIARDVIAPAVVVANTEILVVTYTVQITV